MIIISSIPNLAFKSDNSPFHDRIIEAEEEIKYKAPFITQTTHENSYFKATIESASRNIL